MRLLCVLFAAALIFTACATDSSESASSTGGADGCEGGTINVSGSSTVEPVSARAAELYEDICGDVEITVKGPGTGDGFKLFCSGETDISGASRAIKDSESELCGASGVEYTELKVAFDGIAVLTSPNNAIECLSFVDLYALLGGESNGFDKWSDASDLGAGLGSTVAPYPDADLKNSINGPGQESGTYDSFIEIVLEDVAEAAQGEEFDAIRTDFAGNADDNVIIDGIAGSDSSLGWVGYAFADASKDRVKIIPISEEPGGECIAPTVETIADGSYPVSRALYIYVNNGKVKDNPALAGYVDYYVGDAYTEAVTKAFGSSGYVELPADQLDATKAAWSGAKG